VLQSPRSLNVEENQPKNEIYPQFPIPEHVVSPHVQDPTPPKDSESDSQHAQGPISLRERGRDFSPRQTNNEGPKIRRSGHGRIPQ